MNAALAILLFEIIAVLAAGLILFARSVFHAAIFLLVVVIALGVLFGLFGSEFLFITQIMLYGGGILVIILFATMVSARGSTAPHEAPLQSTPFPFVLGAAGLVSIAATYVAYTEPKGIPHIVTSQELGKTLITDFAFPLEVSGILLLASLIGAAIVAIQKPTEAP